ncbi:hypothetical protein [Phaeobacter inhibens]|uniref:hypothetical protein n=1 Tax=Phaeobacter inhibens TaxID=221822 RepID=UPI000CA288DB|nr:hypothetical protein [Phaeobacter inhibens]AUQ65189.1 hypothetical protein PhaeoP78_00283 [Phaeobacter inhibens]
MKSTSTVKNPLTIIAIFAGLTEVGGTVVLPLLAPDAQSVYIWFLMIFPIFLVLLFFGTLNFNREVLYAPSDWSNEDNFFRKLTKASRDDKNSQVEEEIEQNEEAEERSADETDVADVSIEAESDGPTDQRATELKQGNETSRFNRDIKRQANRDVYLYRAAEEFGVEELSREMKLDFRSNVQFSQNDLPKVIFDGFALDGNTVHVAEVKFARYGFSTSIVVRLINELPRYRLVRDSFLADGKKMVLHLVVVVANVRDPQIDVGTRSRVESMAKKYGLQVCLHQYAWIESERIHKKQKKL